MAKGTLAASAKTTKKGSGSLAASKNGKSAIISDAASTTANKRAKTSASPAAASVKGKGKALSKQPSSDDPVLVELDRNGNERRSLRRQDPKYGKHLKAVLKESLEGMPLLHAEEQDDIETILKLFDLNSEYGPAAGMTRLDRWKRAASWGLDPPTEVWEILSSIEGDKETRYRESLFVGQI